MTKPMMSLEDAGRQGQLNAEAFIAVSRALTHLEALERIAPLFGTFADDKVRLTKAYNALQTAKPRKPRKRIEVDSSVFRR